jgi:Mg2+/Co2+ transporter CorB
MTVYYIAVAGLILLSAFFSAAEISYSSANLVRLENAMEDGSRRAKAAVFIERHYDDALSTILIGNNLVNIAISSIASVAAILLAGEEWTWLATLIVTLLVIVFGETMPKIIAKKNANRLALAFSYVVRA